MQLASVSLICQIFRLRYKFCLACIFFPFITHTTCLLRLITLFSSRIFFPPRSHCVWLIVIFLLIFADPSFVTEADYDSARVLSSAKNGTAAFLKWHKFASLYLAHMSPAWEQWEEGSCGGMIWYELKLFPNRLQRVWSCPLHVWWTLFTSINPRGACITFHQLFSPLSLCSSQ